MRRLIAGLAVPALITLPAAALLPGATAFATTNVATPAPPASSTGTALTVDGLISVGTTSAKAGSGSASSSATALSIDGTTVSGGSEQGNGTNSGNLVDTGQTPLGELQLAPWSATASSNSTSSNSSADAALARADLGGPSGIQVNLLQSHSEAHYTQAESSSSSYSDAATVNVPGLLDIDLLHSQAASGATGSSYLLGINGTDIGTSSQANGQCAIDASPLLTLNCLTASGGPAVPAASAAVVTYTLAGGQLPGGTVSQVSDRGAKAQIPTAVGALQITAQHPAGGGALTSSVTPAAASQGLPFTGFDAALFTAFGLLMLAVGAVTNRAARRGSLA